MTEKVAILGSGIAGLTSAYYLSNTPKLRKKYEITVYQMGWRCGGKLASGRDQANYDRNVEHGLHVWFGYYDNAFCLFKSMFEEWDKPKDCPWKIWSDAFTPQNFTPVGETIDGKETYWPIEWPKNDDIPGEGGVLPSPKGVITQLMNFVKLFAANLSDELFEDLDDNFIPDWIEDLFREKVSSRSESLKENKSIKSTLAHIDSWIHFMDDQHPYDDHMAGISHLLDGCNQKIAKVIDQQSSSNVDKQRIKNMIDLGVAVIRGFFNPKYNLYKDWNLDKINHLDFREWLIENGAKEEVVKEWTVVRAIYDAWFEYVGGYIGKPDFCAGTALRIIIRICLTYKGSVLYLVNSGMGDTVIAPLYEILKKRGVKFKFYHKVVNLKLSQDKNYVEEVEFLQQAKTKNDKEYDPLYEVKGLKVWPSEPFWDQLEHGEQLKKDKINFESRWSPNPNAQKVSITNGIEFDHVVLAIAMGEFKKLNNDTHLADEILAAYPHFRVMTEKLALVPSIGIQLWMNKSLHELGFLHPAPAMDAWTYPNDVWADMTQVIATENWPEDNKPKSLHYLCGTFGNELYKNPSSYTNTLSDAYELGFKATAIQLESTIYSIWPNATKAEGKGFNYDTLFAPDSLQGPQRLKAQYIRVNVEPTECTVGSPAGSFQYRLAADESQVLNLFLAGAWLRTGLDSSCVEAAVMSGMQCANALGKLGLPVIGDGFMNAKTAKSS